MKQSRIRAYMHKQNINTLAKLPTPEKDKACPLVSVYESLTGMRKQEAEHLMSQTK